MHNLNMFCVQMTPAEKLEAAEKYLPIGGSGKEHPGAEVHELSPEEQAKMEAEKQKQAPVKMIEEEKKNQKSVPEVTPKMPELSDATMIRGISWAKWKPKAMKDEFMDSSLFKNLSEADKSIMIALILE